MGLYRGVYGFKPPNEFFTVKNMNCRKIGPNSKQTPQKSHPPRNFCPSKLSIALVHSILLLPRNAIDCNSLFIAQMNSLPSQASKVPQHSLFLLSFEALGFQTAKFSWQLTIHVSDSHIITDSHAVTNSINNNDT